MKTLVYRLTEPTIHTKHYETAAWWTKIEVPAGDYDVMVTTIGHHPTTIDNPNAYWVRVKLPGVVVDEYMPSLYGGVPIGGQSRRPERIGVPMDAFTGLYWYEARDMLNGERKPYHSDRWVVID